MPNYEDAPQARINENSLLNVIGEIESELDILPGTINDLQGKLSPVLMAEQDVLASEIPSANDSIKSVSNNSVTFERLVEILRHIRGAKLRVHEITDRVQI